jgi:microcystin-dependent protein
MADKFVFSNFATSTLSYAISSTDTLLQINVDDVPKFPALVGGAKFPLILTSGDTAEIVYVSALTLTGQATVERGKEGTQAQSWLAGTHVRHSLTASSVIAAAGLRPRGTWSAATSYSAGDLVVQSGIAYVAVVDNLNQAPSASSVYWQLFYQPPGAASTALNFQGIWGSSVTYAVGQAVIYKGRLWQANAANLNSAPAFGNANWTHIAKWSGLASFEGVLAFAGTNNYTITIAASEAPALLYDGLTVKGRFANTNTSSPTLTINSLPPTPLRWKSGVGLAPGDIQAGELYEFTYVEATSEFIAKSVPGQTRLAVPVGMIMDWPTTSTVPWGWYYCNGQAISRTTFAALFAVIGTTYGAGDGANTFNLPNYTGRARFTREGLGGAAHGHLIDGSGIFSATMGAVGGSQYMPTHNHGVNDGTHAHGLTQVPHAHGAAGTTSAAGAHSHTVTAPNATGTAGTGPTNPTAWNFTSVSTSGVGDHTHTFSVTTTAEYANVGGVTSYEFSNISVQNAGFGGYGNLPPLAIVDTLIFAGA